MQQAKDYTPNEADYRHRKQTDGYQCGGRANFRVGELGCRLLGIKQATGYIAQHEKYSQHFTATVSGV